MNVKFHKKCENTGKILKISCVTYSFVKFDIFYFLGLPWETFFVVITDDYNYIFSPWKKEKKNAILFKWFWYTVFVHWK